MNDLDKLTYNEVERLWNYGHITDEQWRAYQKQWAYAGEWFRGRFCYYHYSDLAESLRDRFESQKQLRLFE